MYVFSLENLFLPELFNDNCPRVCETLHEADTPDPITQFLYLLPGVPL